MASVKLKTDNYKNAVNNKQLLELIERVISSYPFSFVNLERLRKEVDAIDELFWVKDEASRYILVNNKFASNFRLTPSQIEGQISDKFIPAYLLNFNKAIEDYIKESRNVFIVEGFPFSGIPAAEDYQALEIPIPGPEGNLYAVIGITQKVKKDETSISLSDSINILRDLLSNYILIDKKNIITDVSEEFCRMFSLNTGELNGKNINDGLLGIPVILRTIINDFIESGNKNYTSKINIPGITDADLNLHFIRGREEEKLVYIRTPVQSYSQPENNSDVKSYDYIIQNIPDPVFIYDKENLRFLQVNETALTLYGYRKDEFLQLDLTDLYTPDDIQTLLNSSDENFKDRIYSRPHRQKRKDGAGIFVDINRTQIIYKGKPAYLNLVRNITEKLNLENERQHFKVAFENSNDFIFITDKEGFIKSVNDSAADILNVSNENLIEASFASLLIDEDRGKINSSLFQSSAKEKFITEVSFKQAGKESIKVKLIANPILNFNGDIESYNIICLPHSGEVKEVIKEVIKEIPAEVSTEKIQSSIPEIRFLSGMFHDLLTPINVIIGFVQDFIENIEQATPDQKETLQIITQNKDKLVGFINQVIDYVQIEKGEVQINAERINLIDLIEELKYEIDASNLLEGGELIFGKISSSLETVTDKTRLLQFFKLTVIIISRVTSQRKIYLSAAALDDKHFAVSFKDNFNISSKTFREKLFEIFTFKSKSLKIPGISSFTIKLSESILNLLKGYYSVQDKGDYAFVFPFKLIEEINEEEEIKEGDENKINTSDAGINPVELNIPGDEKQNESKEASEEKPEQVVKQSSVDLSQLSCIYIEDQLDSQILFSMQMKEIQEINFAISLEQALPLLKAKKFDFIVVDINLQGDYNGLDVLKIVRAMPEYENIPVIAVTAYHLPNESEIYIEAGFSDFISKPLLKENIIDSLEKTLLPQSS